MAQLPDGSIGHRTGRKAVRLDLFVVYTFQLDLAKVVRLVHELHKCAKASLRPQKSNSKKGK